MPPKASAEACLAAYQRLLEGPNSIGIAYFWFDLLFEP